MIREELDLLLINPGQHKKLYGKLSPFSGVEPPLMCGLIAAYVREKGYNVKIIDADAENLLPEEIANLTREYNPLLVAIIVLGSNPSASSTPKMSAARETVRAIKNISSNIKIILGGLHPSALPERTLTEEDVDFICQGEGFHTIHRLLELLHSNIADKRIEIDGLWYKNNGKIVTNPINQNIKNLNELPFAAWDLLPMEKYYTHYWHSFNDIENRGHYAVIYTSLGCPYNCSYCNIHSLYNGKPGIRYRNPEKVIEEIDFLVKNYKIKNLKIIDELFALREDRVVKICDLIKEHGKKINYKLNIWAYARVDTINKNMLTKMKDANINWLAYGFESASSEVRRGVSKRFEQEKIKKVVEMTHDSGINIIGNFMFGLPDDNFDTMQETLNMAKELNLEYVNFYTAMAYPGSQLYEYALKNNIPLPETWNGYSQYGKETLPLPTKYLTSKEVLEFRDNAFKEYFNNPKYLENIEKKFGKTTVYYIKNMLTQNIRKN